MRKSNIFAALIALLPLMVGCASAGMKKPIIYSDPSNKIPADIPSQFLDRYYFLIGKEKKEFNKLQTDEERQVFIDKFWLARDPDPATPENEEKQWRDQLINDVASEPFFNVPNVFGLLFRTNGGFHGDMAKIYLLHGVPNAMDTVEGNLFVDLMLWVYLDENSGRIRYAFLFYQRGSIGAYSLFSQDGYQLDPCGAINEIKKFKEFGVGGRQVCPSDSDQQVLWELQSASSKGGTIDGHYFAWALTNFSSDSSISQGKALQPPKPASEIVKQSEARVSGEAPKLIGVAGVDYILASCKQCNSFIPGKLQLGKEFTLTVRRGDIDWRIAGDRSKSVLKIKLVIEGVAGQAPLVFERWATLESPKDLIISDPSGQRFVPFLTAEEVARIPAGTYRVNVYLKNVTPNLATQKYNAWLKEVTIQ